MESRGLLVVGGPSSGNSSISAMAGDEKKQVIPTDTENEGFNGEDEDEEQDDHQDDKGAFENFVPSPLVPLKVQIEKDKMPLGNRVLAILFVELLLVSLLAIGLHLCDKYDIKSLPHMSTLEDESLRRWKEKLLGCLESNLNDQMEPEVKFHSIGILSPDFGEITTPYPIHEKQSKNILFTMKEGSEYSLKLTFSVLHNIVSGLTYTNTVWKGGIQVDQSRGMIGTFAPQREPYVHTLEEETAPSGVFARGVYTAKLKFEDDDRRQHMELDYSFEIRKRH
ncbi:Rho GDP-dissociation inhibitor [Striga asiatica]|uniref:Rho GDP-dissociation inhibitor n=1 Tax=Striga asiatica TaxID=4170 RepID=A0A5A7QQD3_STRAF|nr:Rho GDP-dissociation inhibitor [Striga asiatica]